MNSRQVKIDCIFRTKTFLSEFSRKLFEIVFLILALYLNCEILVKIQIIAKVQIIRKFFVILHSGTRNNSADSVSPSNNHRRRTVDSLEVRRLTFRLTMNVEWIPTWGKKCNVYVIFFRNWRIMQMQCIFLFYRQIYSARGLPIAR